MTIVRRVLWECPTCDRAIVEQPRTIPPVCSHDRTVHEGEEPVRFVRSVWVRRDSAAAA